MMRAQSEAERKSWVTAIQDTITDALRRKQVGSKICLYDLVNHKLYPTDILSRRDSGGIRRRLGLRFGHRAAGREGADLGARRARDNVPGT